MSARILRRTRVAHALRSAGALTSSRRCYSALAAQLASHDQDAQVHEAVADHPLDTRDIPHASSSSSKLQEEAQGVDAEEPSPLKRKRKARKKLLEEDDPYAQETPSRDPLAPSRAEVHLAAIQAAGLEPTLEDLNRLRPRKHPPVTSPRYSLQYNELLDTVCRTFSKDQLRKLVAESEVDPSHGRFSRKKVEYAESVIEEIWGWPRLADVKKAQRDRTEVSIVDIPATASELFLILGKDGSELLELSKQFNVHISLLAHPLSLRVEGLRGFLSKLQENVADIKKKIVEVVFQLPSKQAIRPDMVQRISRLAGAYLENIDEEGKIKICAKDLRTLSVAKRLASRAAYELNANSQTSILAYTPTSKALENVPSVLFPRAYAMYPFLSPRLLPWTMNTSGAFRVRRVGEWLKRGARELILDTGGLAGGGGNVVTPAQQGVDIHNVLQGALGADANSPRTTYKASIGHILFTTRTLGQRATIIPPLQGQHEITKWLQWIAEGHVQTSFLHSLAPPLIGSQPQQQKIKHRLIYHALPNPSSQTAEQDHPTVRAQKIKQLSFEVDLPSEYFDPDNALDDAGVDVARFDSHCWVGTEARVDLMMPDRPMDMRLSAVHQNNIEAPEQPQELRAYIEGLYDFLVDPQVNAAQPDPPLTLKHGDETFILHTSATVRHSEESVKQSNKPEFQAVTESALDLESKFKSTHCEVYCEDSTSAASWTDFLRHCDYLTASTYVPVGVRRVEESIKEFY